MTFRNLLALIIAIGLRATLAVVRRYFLLRATRAHLRDTPSIAWSSALIDCGHW